MATKHTKAPKVPQTTSKPRGRKIYLNDEDWRMARMFAAKHDLSISDVVRIGLYRIAGEERPETSENPSSSAPSPEKSLETFLTKNPKQK